MSVSITLNVNSQAVSAAVNERTLLVQRLRENLQLTGTHTSAVRAR